MTRWLHREVGRAVKLRPRRGQISVVVHEAYLRDDILCGSPACRSCAHSAPPLPENASHYLIPDSRSLHTYLEILELPQVTGIILLASVLSQVAKLGGNRVLHRIKRLREDRRKQCLVFDDVHHVEIWTAICDWRRAHPKATSREGAEAVVQVAAQWWADHLEGAVAIVLLSDPVRDVDPTEDLDARMEEMRLGENKGQATRGMQLLPAPLYFHRFWSADAEVTLMAQSVLASSSIPPPEEPTAVGMASYPSHLPTAEVEEGCISGTIRVGLLEVSRHDRTQAWVRTGRGSDDLFLPTRSSQNRALHGDTVAARLLPSPHPPEAEGRLGEVVRVMQRREREVVACLRDEEGVGGNGKVAALLCVPRDPRLPLIRIRTREGGRLSGNRFLLRIDGWERDSDVPVGHLTKVVGPIGDLDAECMAVVAEHAIREAPFSAGAMRELPEASWTIPAEEILRRRDLRSDCFTFSIDPPGSTDVDDALSVHVLPSGMLSVGVHIADVSFFVPPHSLLDLEARARGTSTYLVERRIDMLPPVLSENLCSLVGGQDRCAVTCIWTLDANRDFSVVDTWFGRTVIHSRHQLTYEQAQAILDCQPLPARWRIEGGEVAQERIRSALTILAKLTQSWRSDRLGCGALELSSAELKFGVGGRREPLSVSSKQEGEMQAVVAEMMIGANAAVAKRIVDAFPTSALLRRHSAPREEGLKALIECCATRGYAVDASSNRSLSASLHLLSFVPDPVVHRCVAALATRAMAEAEYCGSRGGGGEGVQHYGLALPLYTHFTSPIRRYADVVVHRMIMAAVEGGGGVAKGEVEKVALSCNERHRASKAAQKECSHLYLLTFLTTHPQTQRAVVLKCSVSDTTVSLLLFVPDYDVRATVQVKDASGRVLLPATSHREAEEGEWREGVVVEGKGAGVEIRSSASEGGALLLRFHPLDSVWVALTAQASRTHSPTLNMRLLDDSHPDAQEAARKPRQDGGQQWKKRAGVRVVRTAVGPTTTTTPQPPPQDRGGEGQAKEEEMLQWGSVFVQREGEVAEEARKRYEAQCGFVAKIGAEKSRSLSAPTPHKVRG